MLKKDKVVLETITDIVNKLFEETRGRIDLAEEELRKKGLNPTAETILAYFTGLNYGLDIVKNHNNVNLQPECELTEQVVAE